MIRPYACRSATVAASVRTGGYFFLPRAVLGAELISRK